MESSNLDPDTLIKLLITQARTNFAAFVTATHRPRFKHSEFSRRTCAAVDKFVEDLVAGKRPVLVLTAPPQHGKSSLISRCLPPYLIGRLGLELGTARVALASYALSRAKANGRDAKNIMLEPLFRAIFPDASLIGFKGDINTSDRYSVPRGQVLATGVGGGMTGFSVDVMLIDDAIKDAVEALSPTNQEKLENWFDSVVTTRLQERSGQIIIGTPWSSNDLLAFVHEKFKDDPNYTRLQFVALNHPDQVGFQEDQPRGPLVPELQSEEKLRAVQAHMGSQWWAAMYQQAPLGTLGAIFGAAGTRYYRRGDLPSQFIQVIMAVDAAFKDKRSSDYVAAGVWGKSADGRVWLLEMRRERLSFTRTAAAIAGLKSAYPTVSRILIEDAANGPALIDQLGLSIPGIVGVPTTGSKESRAHAVSWVWENGMVMLPHPDDVPMIKPVVAEIQSFPDTRNDDSVDCMVIALQHLCLRDPISSLITAEVLRLAASR
ncbi:terminase large subunit [Xanthomonas phage NEB7]|nr:terminase large subunit [Xanthomonas phage NEB7]